MVNLRRILTCCIVAVGAMIFTSPRAHAATGVCPDSWGCGANAATVGDGIVFDELNSVHEFNKDGIQLGTAWIVVGTTKKEVELSVMGHDLSARDKLNNTVYQGLELKGMTMTIEHFDGRQYEVRVEKVCINGLGGCQALDFWVNPTTRDQVPYYELLVRKTHRRNTARPDECPTRTGLPPPDDRCTDADFKEQLCKGESLTDDYNFWYSYKHAAIFLAGDRFDAKSKTVGPPLPGWFNLACAGAVIAKMHLLRHTAAGTDYAHQTTPTQRTAMLKMLTADYCGDGKAWTADGTPLFYTDRRGWYQMPPLPLANLPPGTIEALWGPTGALCLNTPRRTPRPTLGCKPPAVTRSEVVSSCTKMPPIPVCDQTWRDKWTSPQQSADAPYILSVIKDSPELGFCDNPGP